MKPFPLALAATLAAAALAAPAAAQDAAPQPGAAPAKPAPAFADPRTGEQVRVRLKTGGTVEGLVLARSVWERRDPVRGWTEVGRGDRGAGVRLWYTDDLDGFQWVAVGDIVEVKSLGVATDEQRREMETRCANAAKRAEEARRRADEEKATVEDASAKAKELLEAVEKAKAEAAAAAAVDASKKEDQDKAKRWAELLARFPADKWSPETPKEIDRRRTVMHVFPSDDEQEFLKVFTEWSEAYAAFKKAGELAKTGKSAAK